VRAVKQCAPFQLPPDKYAAWSTVTWAFDWPVILGLVQR
jgi:colicin import membrane protein